MYEERERFSFKEVILQIILVVLFVFLLLWLFPTKSYVDNKVSGGTNVLDNQTFTQNVNTMKEAAISYFTTSRLPKKVGDKETLTLGQMLDKKLLISFLDSNGNQCNLTDSYVEITKMDNEYILKVNLNCTDKSDYVLVHLGCYSYCESDLCEKQETTEPEKKPETKPTVKPTVTKKYQYEYELVIPGKWSDWSNWSAWSTKKVEKNDSTNVKTKEQTVITGTENKKVGIETIVTDAKEIVSSSCPKGYDLDDSKTKCIGSISKTETIAATVTKTPSCPSGYSLKGEECSKEVKYVSSYKKGEYVETVYNATSVPKDTNKYFYEEVGADYVFACKETCSFNWVYTYKVYKSTPVYKTKTETIAATITEKLSCPSKDYKIDGKTCTKEVSTEKVIDATKSVEYSCTTGDLVNKTCVTYKDKYETVNTYGTVTYYSYQTRKYTEGTKKTEWSNSNSDQNLIKLGYKLTGNKKEI